MKKLLFGTAGIPISTKPSTTINGIKRVKELKLSCMELEFVRGIYLKENKTEEIKQLSKKENIILSCHAPYYINLNSEDKKKYHASISYIVNSAKIASLCNCYSVCFHAGYYQKQPPEKVYTKIKQAIKEIISKVKQFDNKIYIRPEISGKVSQFGNLNEIIKLSKEIEQVQPCIDFAHQHARTIGEYNTKKDFKETLTQIEKHLGRYSLNNMHIHLSGINYTNKGERNHLTLKECKLNYKDLLKVFKEFKIKGVVISESPNIEKDALLMKEIYEKN